MLCEPRRHPFLPSQVQKGLILLLLLLLLQQNKKHPTRRPRRMTRLSVESGYRRSDDELIKKKLEEHQYLEYCKTLGALARARDEGSSEENNVKMWKEMHAYLLPSSWPRFSRSHDRRHKLPAKKALKLCHVLGNQPYVGESVDFKTPVLITGTNENGEIPYNEWNANYYRNLNIKGQDFYEHLFPLLDARSIKTVPVNEKNTTKYYKTELYHQLSDVPGTHRYKYEGTSDTLVHRDGNGALNIWRSFRDAREQGDSLLAKDRVWPPAGQVAPTTTAVGE